MNTVDARKTPRPDLILGDGHTNGTLQNPPSSVKGGKPEKTGPGGKGSRGQEENRNPKFSTGSPQLYITGKEDSF